MHDFESRLRWALSDPDSHTKADAPTVNVQPAAPIVNVEPPKVEVNVGPFRWKHTPVRDAEGLIVYIESTPIARVDLPA